MDTAQVYGLCVRMDRAVDRLKPCHDNITVIRDGRGPHAAELKCITCDAHRGWLSKNTFAFLEETVRCFGVSSEPFTIHDATIGNESMTDIADIYPDKGQFLKAGDLQNRIVTVLINEVVIKEVGNGSLREKKPVAMFKGKNKGLILNKTNARVLRDLYGPRIEDWAQKKITMFPTTTDFPTAGTACIRLKAPKDYVRPEPSEEAAEEVEPPKHDDMDDEIPF
jgi:hypothetical protein